jgi:fatty-acyl-CoA synthase
MFGAMMQQPLLISSLLTHAERHHGEQEIVSRRVEGDLHRCTFREMAARTRQLANALAALGVQQGDRIATLAWNGHRHLELYYAVSGSGAVLHTLNPRLHPDRCAGSPTTRRTRCCSSTSASCRWWKPSRRARRPSAPSSP